MDLERLRIRWLKDSISHDKYEIATSDINDHNSMLCELLKWQIGRYWLSIYICLISIEKNAETTYK